MKPTREQALQWAREAERYANENSNDEYDDWFKLNDLHFATLAYKAGYEAGRKDKNEACAKVCEELGYYAKHGGCGCADAIRERGAP